MADLQNVTVHIGDTAQLTVNAKDCADAPADVSDLSIAYYVRAHSAGVALITKSVDIEEDEITVTLLPSDTVLIGRYFHELIATDGSVVWTGFTGVIDFTYDLVSSVCEALEAIFDMEVFAEGAPPSLNFSVAGNSQYLGVI